MITTPRVHTIEHPSIPDFSGVVEGVTFADGVATSADAEALDFFHGAGYRIDGTIHLGGSASVRTRSSLVGGQLHDAAAGK